MDRYGISVGPDNVLITTGSQQALDLIGKLFINAGDHVLCEAPTFLGALQAFSTYQAEYLPVPIDEDGMRVDLLEDALRAAPKFIYVLPNFQNPGGVTLSEGRRHELVLLADGATSHRPILGEYSAYLLDQMIAVVTASTLIAYVFYTISPETQQKFGTPWLGLTIPFPLYGIFRYLYLVHQREGGGSPADLLLTDRPLLTCVALWALAVALIIYRPV